LKLVVRNEKPKERSRNMFATIGSLNVFKTWDRGGTSTRPSWLREATAEVAMATSRRPSPAQIAGRSSP
jgi:hypothetical protein